MMNVVRRSIASSRSCRRKTECGQGEDTDVESKPGEDERQKSDEALGAGIIQNDFWLQNKIFTAQVEADALASEATAGAASATIAPSPRTAINRTAMMTVWAMSATTVRAATSTLDPDRVPAP